MKLFSRRSRGKVLRPLFEWIVLVASALAGFGVIGSCVGMGSKPLDSSSVALILVGGLVFAIPLVGAVYLLTTMSRDLRQLREHYVDDAALSAAKIEMPRPEESTGADI